jgi:FKBP-type peptidyl-prolyl cis-trans isomerase
MCWSILVLAAITLTACTTMGTSTARGTGIGISSCPTPAVAVQRTIPPASPPVVKGVTTTTSDGLQEIDVQVGCGTVVRVGQTVIVEYTGWVQGNGKLFDSSFEHQPSDCQGTVQNTCGFELTEGAIIQGWIEGVAGMKVGGSRRLIIPPAVAYGALGAPPAVPGNATLIFDITVVGDQ